MSSWWTAIEAVMRSHLKVAGQDAFRAAKTFEAATYLEVADFADVTTDMKAIDVLEIALRKVSPLLNDVSTASMLQMLSYFHHSGRFNDEEAKRLSATLYCLSHESDALLDSIDAARKSLKDGGPMVRKSTKTLNIEAIRAVQGAVESWTLFQSAPPPAKALNPASPFGNFLADLLEACSIQADPKSAFRAWAQTYGRTE